MPEVGYQMPLLELTSDEPRALCYSADVTRAEVFDVYMFMQTTSQVTILLGLIRSLAFIISQNILKSPVSTNDEPAGTHIEFASPLDIWILVIDNLNIVL